MKVHRRFFPFHLLSSSISRVDAVPLQPNSTEMKKKVCTLQQSYPAQIEGRQSVKIIPRVEGYLRQICVKEGQRVKKGQVLFVIDQATNMGASTRYFS